MAMQWKIDEKTRTLTIRGKGAIPDYKDDNKMQQPWFMTDTNVPRSKKNLTVHHIKVGSGITSIGDYTFEGLKNVETVELPHSIKTIGACAFWGCSELELSMSNKEIDSGKDAFRNVKSVEIRTHDWIKF